MNITDRKSCLTFDTTEQIVEMLNAYVVKFANEYVITNRQEEWIKVMVEKLKDYKEGYTEQVVAQGTDEGGEYKIIQEKFGINSPGSRYGL